MTARTGNRKSANRRAVESFEVFQQAIAQHQFISEYAANLGRTTGLFREEDPQRKLAAMQAFLTSHVFDHFAFEEQQVFPQLRAAGCAPATAQVLQELIAEHQPLLSEARNVERDLQQLKDPADGRAWARLEKSFEQFLTRLQEHAVKEDNILLAEKYGRKLPAGHRIPT